MTRVGAFFSRPGAIKPLSSSEKNGTDEAVVGKTLSPELFREELAGLGYDFEVFADGTGKIWRFRRISPQNDRSDGDVW
jgi:hypothetical protein